MDDEKKIMSIVLEDTLELNLEELNDYEQS